MARALDLLGRGWVDVMATDAHDAQTRPPRLAAGLRAAARILGEEDAQALVAATPMRIVDGG